MSDFCNQRQFTHTETSVLCLFTHCGLFNETQVGTPIGFDEREGSTDPRFGLSEAFNIGNIGLEFRDCTSITSRYVEYSSYRADTVLHLLRRSREGIY